MSDLMSEVEISLKVAQGFCQDIPDFIYCLEEDCFYMYEDGLYKKIFNREMHDLVLTKKSFTKKMTLQGLKNVVDRIATLKKCRLESFNTEGRINFINGLFDLNTGILEPHTPAVISTIRLPYRYDPSLECPLWIKTLDEIMEGDKNKTRTLQEFFGYCLTREVSYEKALILTGDGANGKSTILHTLEHIVGEENCSALSLRYLSDPQKVSVLVNKLVNICGEVPKKVDDFEAEFRTIVTGEKLTVSPKYVKEYTIKPFCKLVMAVNEFPYIDDRTSAFYRRLLIIDLKRQFTEEEQNKDLRKQLLGERSGIFNWAVEGLKRLQERKTFVIDEYMKQTIDNIKEMNNPIMQWCKENVMIFKGEELLKCEAFEEYKKWSDKNGYKPYGMAKFSAEVYKNFSKHTEKDRRSTIGQRPRMWPNLAFRTQENEVRAANQAENIEWKE